MTDRAELLPSGVQAVYKNRAGWAHDRLKRAGYSASLRRGYWKLTPEGVGICHANREPLSTELPSKISLPETPMSDSGRRRATRNGIDQRCSIRCRHVADREPGRQARAGARRASSSSVAAELLEVLSQVSPQHFETIVLDLLHRMGYGASRADLQRVGGVGDGGIDGVISLDKLGLEKVYVQAKRWQGSVGRPDVQGFYGALAGQRANKGVFITTSTFSPQALEFARSVERIVLIDGAKLAELMIEHEVGVTLRPVKVPKLDSDYFEG